jgi:hypothetical protein
VAALVGVPGSLSLALVVGVAGVAGAQSIAVQSRLGAATAAVPDCGDLTVARVGYAVTTGTVRSVTVSGVPASCDGASVRVALVSSTGAALATAGPGVLSGGTVTLTTLTANPSPTAVSRVHVSAVGP